MTQYVLAQRIYRAQWCGTSATRAARPVAPGCPFPRWRERWAGRGAERRQVMIGGIFIVLYVFRTTAMSMETFLSCAAE